MNTERSPKLPAKPSRISRDPIASAEWDRICDALRNNPNILEVGEGPIEWAAGLYSGIARMDQLLQTQGRTRHNQPMQDDQIRAVERYLREVGELEVEPGPVVRIRLV